MPLWPLRRASGWSDVRTKKTMVVLVTLSLAGTVACSASKSGGTRLLDELETMLQSSSSKVDDVVSVRKQVAGIPVDELTSEQQIIRNKLLRDSDAFLGRLTTSELDASITSARIEVANQAEVIAAGHASPSTESRFLTELKEVTKEVIEEEGCGLILDAVAPSQRPAEPGKDAESEDDPATSAFKKLSARWAPSFLNRAVAWVEYSKSVAKDANQFAEAVVADPDAYVLFISRPELQRAAAAYARACYSTPRPIF